MMDDRTMRSFTISTGTATVMLFLAVMLCGGSALAASPVAVVGEKAVYLHWGLTETAATAYRIERSEGDGKFAPLARVAPVSDPKQARELLAHAPDAFSHTLTVGDDFPHKTSEYPDLDRALALTSVGYAQARAQGYMDGGIRRDRRYRYRVTALAADGTETAIGEVDVDTGAPTKPLTPVIQAELAQDWPVISFAASPLVRYHIERADRAEGPFQRISFVPLVAARAGETLRHEDKNVVLDGRAYYYHVVPQTVFDQAGVASVASAVRTPDHTPPAPPLVALPDNRAGAVGLSWQGNGEPDLAGFHIYRREVLKGEVGDKQPRLADEKRLTAKSLAATVLQFEDRELVPGHVYQYAVSALDRSGNESAQSPPILARPRDLTPPTRPSGLAARMLDNGRVMLSWTPNTDADLYAYRIYLAADDGTPRFQNELAIRELEIRDLKPGATVTHPGATVTHEMKLDVNSEATYRYALTAVDASENESQMSEAVTVRLPDHVPPAAPIIHALAAESGALVLSWEPSTSDDVAGYQVWRGDAPTELARLTDKPLPSDTLDYRDGTARPGSILYYAVSALDLAGNESQCSEPRSATTFARSEPRAPSELRLDTSTRPARLLWQAQDMAKAFVLYIGTARDGDYHQYGELLTAASAALPVATDETRWYRVQTVYADGAVSALSSPVAQPGKNEGR